MGTMRTAPLPLRSRFGGIVLLLTIMLPVLNIAAQVHDEVTVIKAGRIVTVTNGVLENGAIVIRGGLIEAVGTNLAVPPGADVIKADSLWVYPGLFDAFSSVALQKPKSESGENQQNARNARQGGGSNAVLLEADRMAAEMLDLKDSKIKRMRESGITTALTVPGEGIFTGQAAIIHLAEDEGEGVVIKADGPQHLGYQGQRRAYPTTLMGVIAFQRQTFLDAWHHKLVQERYSRSPRGLVRPEFNPALDVLIPVLVGEKPILISADTENELKRAVSLAREFHLKPILNGATEGYRVLEYLKKCGAPVIVDLNFPKPEQVTGYAYKLEVDGPGETAADTKEPAAGKMKDDPGQRGKMPADRSRPDSKKQEVEDKDMSPIYGNAASINQAGLLFAFSSRGLSKLGDFLANARKTVEYGLDPEAALRALTINPALIYGIDESIGSIEAGKIADLIITTGDLMSDSTEIKWVIVDGKKTELKEQPRAAGKPQVNLSGVWKATITTAMGDLSATMTLSQNGSEVTGTFASELGESEIERGTVGGNIFSFSVSLPVMGQERTISLNGTVEGNRIEGTADLGRMGSADWTAIKPG